MRTLVLPYTKYLVSPPHARKAQYVFRPVIPVRMSFARKEVAFDALVDSGADACTFPGWVAQLLGRDVHSGQARIFSGIGGSVLSYRHKTTLSVGDHRFHADVFYSHEWDDMPFGLLGQAGFFSVFDVEFAYHDKSIRLRKH